MRDGPLRISLALFVAGAIPATVVAVPVLADQLHYFSGKTAHFAATAAINSWLISFFVALAHAIILGLPTYLFLRRLHLTNWWVSPIFGFIIGSVPSAIFTWPLTHSPVGYTAWDGKAMVDYVVNGVPTKAGWIQYFQSVCGVGLLGMLSGLAAWAVWYWLPRTATKGSGSM